MRIADRAIVLAAIVLVAATGCDQLSGRNQNRQGNRLFRDGLFPDAVGEYEQALRKVNDPVIHYNVGLAYQKIFKAGYSKSILLAFQSEPVCAQIPKTKPVEATVCVKEGDRHYATECVPNDPKQPCPALSTCTKATFCALTATEIAEIAAAHMQTWIKAQPSDDVIKANIKKVEAKIADTNAALELLAVKVVGGNAKIEALATDDEQPTLSRLAEIAAIKSDIAGPKSEIAPLDDRLKDLGREIDDLNTKERIRGLMTQMLIDSDQYKQALDYWTGLLNEKPNDPALMGVLAGINLKANDWRTSIQWYLKVAAAATDVSAKVAAYTFIGNVAWSKLNSKTLTSTESLEIADRGIGALQKAIELQPNNPKPPYGLEASLYNFRALTSGASWASAIDRASAQDLQHTMRVLNDKAKAANPAPGTPPAPGPNPAPVKTGG